MNGGSLEPIERRRASADGFFDLWLDHAHQFRIPRMKAKKNCVGVADFPGCGGQPRLAGQHNPVVHSMGSPSHRRRWTSASPHPGAFTLIELVVVITIVAVLAALLLPALSASKAKAQAVFCQNNYRQLQLAWCLYVSDHNDSLPPNEGQDRPRPPRSDVHFWWAQGNMDFDNDNSQNLDAGLLLNPEYALLGSYSKTASIYRCPSDRSRVFVDGVAKDRVRSVSMNEYLGGMVNCWINDPTPNGPQRMSQIPRPAMTFAFIDHHPDSITSPLFQVDRNQGENLRIISWPGIFHGQGASVTFVDGHAELHRWRDDRTVLPVRYNHDDWPPADQLSPNNRDIQWLQERTVFP